MPVRLFIGNLPYDAQAADLRALFAPVGEPLQILIPADPGTGRPRGFAFVDVEDRARAEEAIRRFDGQPFKGRTLAVSEARPREGRGPAGPPRPAGAPSPTPGAAPARTRGDRPFGPDAPKRRSGPGGRRQRTERSPKGPIRERGGGRFFAIEDDQLEQGPDLDDDFATGGGGDAGPDEQED